jgi:hypothetical protein
VPRKGVAHFELLGPALEVPGDWDVQVDARISDFDAYSDRSTITVRRR